MTTATKWVLVIEDEEEISSFLRYVLEGEEYRVTVAASLAEARAALKTGLPNALLLDRNLPDGDGLELCKELKGSGERRPAVLFISARRDPDEVREGLAAGADDYVPKPFQFTNVLSRLNGLLALL